MSTTTTTTTEQQQQPSYATIKRLSSIPLVSDSLSTIHSTLSSSPYTQSAYTTAQSITSSAYRASAPITLRLAPVLTRADGYADRGLAAVEDRFPYPFHTPTETIIGDVKSQTETATATATKTFDEKIRTPAYGLAQSVDQRLTPFVDQYAALVHKVSPSTSTPSSPSTSTSSDSNASTSTDENGSKSQVGRAYRLSVDLRDQIFVLSAEQIKQLQGQSVLLQRATETVTALNTTLTNTFAAAKGKTVAIGKDATVRVHALSQSMLQELEKYQSATAQLPAHVQNALKPLSDAVQSTTADLRTIASSSDLSLSEKAGKIGSTVQDHLAPVLKQANNQVQAFLNGVWHKEEAVKAEAKEPVNGAVNANGSASNGH